MTCNKSKQHSIEKCTLFCILQIQVNDRAEYPLVGRILGALDKEHPFNGFGPEMLQENLRFIDYSMIKCVLE